MEEKELEELAFVFQVGSSFCTQQSQLLKMRIC